jgi:hypothetical protein
MFDRKRHGMQQACMLWDHIRNRRMTINQAIQMLTISRDRRDAVILLWQMRRHVLC